MLSSAAACMLALARAGPAGEPGSDRTPLFKAITVFRAER
jgi:hypothetical protein